MVDKDFIFSRIGMALISAQRVEYITGELVKHLSEFDKDVYGITSEEFLGKSPKAIKARMTLGKIFILLKLNSNLVIANELDEYLVKRNMLAHGFWKNYLDTVSEKQAKRAVEFCNDFGSHSNRIESFFKGLMFFLARRLEQDGSKIDGEVKGWESDFDYFITAIHEKRLFEKDAEPNIDDVTLER